MKLIKIMIVVLSIMGVFLLPVIGPKSVEGQADEGQADAQAIDPLTDDEALTTDLNVLTDELFNEFGQRGTPIDECAGEPVRNRSFEDNKFIFDELEAPDDGLGSVYNAPGCADYHQNPEAGGISQVENQMVKHSSLFILHSSFESK